MTFVSSPSPTLDNNSNLNQPPADAPPYMIDFFAGRDRLLEEIDNRKRSETKHQLRRAPFPCKLSVELFDPLEDWLCSLISAAVLVSVLLGILSMPDFPMPRTHVPRPEPNSYTEPLSIMQKAG
jgi:hypothetical protein